jgi:hypothetical protein
VIDVCKEPSDLQQLSDLLVTSQLGAARGPQTGGMGVVAGSILAAVWEVRGADAGRQLFSQLAMLPPAGGDFYRRMLQLEGAELDAAAGQKPSSKKTALQRVRRVFEAAVTAFGDCDAGLWLMYCRFEQEQASQGAGPVYWRAVKALADPEAFVQEFRASVCAATPAGGV